MKYKELDSWRKKQSMNSKVILRRNAWSPVSNTVHNQSYFIQNMIYYIIRYQHVCSAVDLAV